MNSPLVWYAAYGSNLSLERFESYLRGGRPRGSSRTCPGCRDASPPRAWHAGRIEAELVFGGGPSVTWGGGVAFVESEGPHETLVRCYLISLEQFEDVVSQENWLEPGAVGFEGRVPSEPLTITGNHMYRVVMPLGRADGHPIVTVSQVRGTPELAPGPAYLAHVAQGLSEAHSMDDQQIADYLSDKRGVAGAMSREDVLHAIAGREAPGSG